MVKNREDSHARPLCVTALLMVVMLTACETLAPNKQVSTEKPQFDPVAASFRADVEELTTRIKQNHPQPFRLYSETEFDRHIQILTSQFDRQTTVHDLLWTFSDVMSLLGCTHSRLPYFNQEDSLITPADRFPLDVRFVDGQLIVIDPTVNGDVLQVGDVVTQINDRSVPDLIAEIYRHIGTDANLPYYKRHMFNMYATSYLTFALDFPSSYEVLVRRLPGKLRLSPLSEFTFRPLVNPADPCQNSLCFRVDETSSTGIMTLRSFAFYGDRGKIFSGFIDDSLAALVNQQLSSLIIDVRGNQGGSGLASAYLLRRLADQPFDYFSADSDPRGQSLLFEVQMPVEAGFAGEVYILMDGNTISTTPHFLALAKEHQMAILAGEPAGGNRSTHDGSKKFSSSEHGVNYKVARMRFDVATPSMDSSAAIMPDIPIPYSVRQTLTGEDLMLQSLLDTIKRRGNGKTSAGRRPD